MTLYHRNFIFHEKSSDECEAILIMERKGKAFARIYWYSDDDTTVYLSGLSVNEKFRNKHIGTKLQEIREDIGKNLGAKNAILLAHKNTWMYEWYRRRGYSDYFNRKDEDGAIWMIKSLNKL